MKVAASLMLAACALAAPQAYADKVRTRLQSFQEVPSVSSAAKGRFEARIDDGMISYELSYEGLEGNVLQAHIHFGQKSVNGGIGVFLCSNLGNGPAGTQTCPTAPATITGVIQAADVIGPVPQGIAAGELAELLKAIDAGVAYVNVHSDKFPGGEVRGQLGRHD